MSMQHTHDAFKGELPRVAYSTSPPSHVGQLWVQRALQSLQRCSGVAVCLSACVQACSVEPLILKAARVSDGD